MEDIEEKPDIFSKGNNHYKTPTNEYEQSKIQPEKMIYKIKRDLRPVVIIPTSCSNANPQSLLLD